MPKEKQSFDQLAYENVIRKNLDSRRVKRARVLLGQSLAESRAKGQLVHNSGPYRRCELEGDTEERFDLISEEFYAHMREILKQCGVQDAVIELLVADVRRTFQAHILYLREKLGARLLTTLELGRMIDFADPADDLPLM